MVIGILKTIYTKLSSKEEIVYFDLKTDYYGWPIEHIIGHPVSNWTRHIIQLLRKWLHLHKVENKKI
jgi:hypothetical protein